MEVAVHEEERARIVSARASRPVFSMKSSGTHKLIEWVKFGGSNLVDRIW